MALEGLLSQIDLATLLQTLKMEAQEGVLYLTRGNNKANLYVSKDGVRYLAPEEGDYTDFIEVLFRHRFIKRDELEKYKAKLPHSSLPLGEMLIEDGLISEEALEQIMGPFFSEKLFELFDWRDGNFRFENMAPKKELEFFDAEGGGLYVTFDINFLNLELVHRRDEWTKMRELIPSDECIFLIDESAMAANPYQRDQFSKETRKVLHLLDGKKNVAQIKEHSGNSSFATCTVLYELYTQGVIKLLDVTYLIQEAEAFYRDERFLEGDQRYLSAIKINPNNITLRRGFAKRCMQLGKKDSAAKQFVGVAVLLMREGKVKEAQMFYQKAMELCPKNLDFAQQYFFFLLSREDSKAEAHGLGFKTARQYLLEKNFQKSAEIYQALRKKFPQDPHCRKELVVLYQKLEQSGPLAKIYEELAELYLAEGNYEEAHKYYNNLSELEPSREDILHKLKGLEQFITISAQSPIAKYIWAGIYVFILSGAVYLIYSFLEFKYHRSLSPAAGMVQRELVRIQGETQKLQNSSISQKKGFLGLLKKIEKNNADLNKLIEKINFYAQQDSRMPSLGQKANKTLQKSENLYSATLVSLKKENYSLIKQANQWESEKRLEDALGLYQKVVSSPYNFPKVPPFVNGKISFLIEELSKVNRRVQKIRSILRGGEYRKGLVMATRFFLAYKNTKAAQNLGFPLYLQSYPPGSTATFSQSAKSYTTPCLVFYNPLKKQILTISRRGFRPFELAFKFQWTDNATKMIPLSNNYDFPAEAMESSFHKALFQVALDKDPLWKKKIPGAQSFFFRCKGKYIYAVANTRGSNYQKISKLIQLDLVSGTRQASFSAQGYSGGVLMTRWKGQERFYFPCSKILYCIAFDGKGKSRVVWTHIFNKKIESISQKASSDGLFALADEGGTVHVIHPEDGRVLRNFPTYSPLNGGLIVIGDDFYFSCKDGRIYGQKLSGGQFWQEDLESLATSSLAVDQDFLALGDEDGKISGFSPQKNKKLWTFSPSEKEGKILLNFLWGKEVIFQKQGSDFNTLYSVQQESGEKNWDLDIPPKAGAPFFSVYESYLFFGGKKKFYIYSLRPSKKPLLFWRTTLNGRLASPPKSFFVKSTRQTIFLAGTKTGTIYCYVYPQN